jgi:hypothetical protein
MDTVTKWLTRADARRRVVQQQPEVDPRPSGTFRPIWDFAHPSTGTVRVALFAVAVGTCAGAISNFDVTIFKEGTAIIPTKPSSVPTDAQPAAVKPQSLPAEPERAAKNETNPTIGVQTEAVKTESFSAGSKTKNTVTSFDNDNLAKQAETSIDGQRSSSSAPAAAQQGHRDFPVPVPPDWSVLAPEKSNEWRAVSPGRNASLSLYATPVRSLSSHLDRWGVTAGDRVTYQKRGRGWNVVSGYTADNRIFYRKTMLACGGRKWHNLEFEYPASDKRAMDEFVTRAAYALGSYSGGGC